MPLRLILLTGMVSIICVFALINPVIGLYGYIWYGLMRPDILAWSYGQYPFSIILAISVLLGSIRYFPNFTTWFKNPICLGVLALILVMSLSAFFAVYQEPSLNRLNYFLRGFLIALFIPVLIRDLTTFHRLMLVILTSLGFIAFKFGAFGIYHGGVRFGHGYGGFISDNNFLGLAMAMLAPMCLMFAETIEKQWTRYGFIGIAGLAVATTLMSDSRRALVALLGAGAIAFLYSRRKKIILALGALAVIPLVFLTTKDQILTRWDFLETGTLDASAASRIDHAIAAIKMWKDHPVLGVGFGTDNYVILSPSYLGRPNVHNAHNTYLQMLCDSGLVALLLYCAILFGCIFWLHRSAKAVGRVNPSWSYYPYSLQVGLIAFAVGSSVGARTYYDFLYILLMCAAAWYTVHHELLSRQAASPPELPDSAPALIPAPSPIAGRLQQQPGIATRTREETRNEPGEPRARFLRSRNSVN